MQTNLKIEIASLAHMSVSELLAMHRRVFGEDNRSRHRDYLRKKIAWRLQAQAYGGLSERAEHRAMEIATDADIRIRMPATAALVPEAPSRTEVHSVKPVAKEEPELLTVGTVLTRPYRGRNIHVMVLENGFEYDGKYFRSLSAIAKAVTGSHWNGKLFFGLKKGKEAA